MIPTKRDTLRVPGANLYYELRGLGPFLLLIAGGDGGGEGYNGVANQLAERYTVVTYDRRGFARSTLDEPAADMHLETHSDDAHRLLAALTNEPAYVFGSSAGALIGLDLVLHHPEQARMLVAHEPPVEGVLPSFDQFQADLLETYRNEGGMAAMRKFVTQLGVRYDTLEPGVELPQRNPRPAGSSDDFFRYTFMAVHRYRLDVAALAASRVRVVLASGSAGRENPAYQVTAALAERLGMSIVEFPSHHAGYVSYPKAFAAKLSEVLGDESGAIRVAPHDLS